MVWWIVGTTFCGTLAFIHLLRFFAEAGKKVSDQKKISEMRGNLMLSLFVLAAVVACWGWFGR